MKKISKIWLYAIYGFLGLLPVVALADYTVTTGAGSTVFAFVCSVSKICPATVLINSSNTEIGTNANPIRIDPTGTTTQPISAASAAYASGAYASGSIASGAYASGSISSGAVASGAYASGSIASGAMVDLGSQADAACGTDTGSCSLIALTKRTNQDIAATGTVNPGTAANWGIVATGAAPPANAVYLGANASGATGGHVAALISCDSHVFKHITSATDTLAVQGVASQTIRICGWRSRAAGTATWFLENTASANANCASANTQITGVATEAANTGETMLAPFWTGLANTAGNGLCINSTGTGGVDVDIWYTQF